jgi:excisionase family DNA binding protein
MKPNRLSNPDGNGMLSKQDVCARLGIGEKALRSLVTSGRLTAYKIGTGRTSPIKFRELDVRLFLESARVQPAIHNATLPQTSAAAGNGGTPC